MRKISFVNFDSIKKNNPYLGLILFSFLHKSTLQQNRYTPSMVDQNYAMEMV